MTNPPGTGPPRPRTSALLADLHADIDDDGITVGELITNLRRRAYGAIFLLLGLISLLPGISVLGGLLIAWFSLQMAAGLKAPAVPRAIGRVHLPADRLRRGLDRVIPLLERLEKHISPRWPWLTERPLLNLTGVFMAAVSLAFALPVPFTQFPPALAIIFVAIGMLERDGRLLAAGFAVGCGALTIGYFAVKGTGQALGFW